jgi:CheY-like chemotaxis protein
MEHIDHALMNDRVHSVLVVGNDPAAAAAIRDALAPPGDHPCSTLWARNLAAGVARLDEGGIDAIVLDLFLPDSQGIDSFDEMYLAARRVPIIVLEASDHEEIARLAVQRGAKDRVLKKHIDRRSFPSMLRDG